MPRGCSCPLCPWYKVWKDWCLLTQEAVLSLFLLSSWAQTQPGHIPALWLGGRSCIPYSTAVAISSEFLNSAEQRRMLELLGPFWLCSRGSSTPQSSILRVYNSGFWQITQRQYSCPKHALCRQHFPSVTGVVVGLRVLGPLTLKAVGLQCPVRQEGTFPAMLCSVSAQQKCCAAVPQGHLGLQVWQSELETVSKNILASPKEALMALPKPAPFTFKSKSADEPNCF